jgi:hypothetical protein
MITLLELETILQTHKNNKSYLEFWADSYKVCIDFKDKIHLLTVIENLNQYLHKDKLQRLNYYIKNNSNALGYIYSTLAYTKNDDVIVQRWLNHNLTLKQTVAAIDDLLQHADILTTTL